MDDQKSCLETLHFSFRLSPTWTNSSRSKSQLSAVWIEAYPVKARSLNNRHFPLPPPRLSALQQNFHRSCAPRQLQQASRQSRHSKCSRLRGKPAARRCCTAMETSHSNAGFQASAFVRAWPANIDPAIWGLENYGTIENDVFFQMMVLRILRVYVDRMVMFHPTFAILGPHFRTEPSTDGHFAEILGEARGISLSPRRIWGSLTPRFQRCGHGVVRVKTLWLLLLNLPELLVKLGNKLCPVWPKWFLHIYIYIERERERWFIYLSFMTVYIYM